MVFFIESMSHSGEGVARYGGKVIFISYAIQGEVVEADIKEEKKNYSRGILRKVIDQSDYRIEPKCPYYFECGGCSYQHITYQQQLMIKQKIVEQILKRIGGIKTVTNKVKGVQDPWHYRNKVLWHINEDFNGKKMGFYHYHTKKLIEVKDCPILQPHLNIISSLIRERLSGISIRENSSVMIRQSSKNKEVVIEFINCNPDQEVLNRLAQEANSIYSNHNGKTRLLSGQDLIREETGGYIFHLGPDDFYQINSEQIELLIYTVSQYLDLSECKKIVDAYCGVGIFSINIARKVSQVIGIDSNKKAIDHAKTNALVNKITNCQFMVGLCEKILPALSEPFDCMIMDPPRAGLKKGMIHAISHVLPKEVIYVSCDPGTLARDLKQFTENNYQVVFIQPIDMFPQTSHIENVVLLRK
ncbi:MAG: 23S rRNA (uracil(1939)-C(5))-methyltransferase RlmD [Candidatus Atribacteria bacterium]|nr:23S rRNA (uracil(1939)-C(5))-methyltransferase RlmD [Candidatus Atribacteria bacterium]